MRFIRSGLLVNSRQKSFRPKRCLQKGIVGTLPRPLHEEEMTKKETVMPHKCFSSYGHRKMSVKYQINYSMGDFAYSYILIAFNVS